MRQPTNRYGRDWRAAVEGRLSTQAVRKLGGDPNGAILETAVMGYKKVLLCILLPQRHILALQRSDGEFPAYEIETPCNAGLSDLNGYLCVPTEA